MTTIPAKLIEDTARELTARAAIDIPPDYRDGVRLARDRETNRIARFVLDESKATAAKTRVLITSGDGDETWGTVGVADNIIEASWQALVDSVEYKLRRDERRGQR